jgi:hypothetical protein
VDDDVVASIDVGRRATFGENPSCIEGDDADREIQRLVL